MQFNRSILGFYNLNNIQRKEIIIRESGVNNCIGDLQQAAILSSYINQFILDYMKCNVEHFTNNELELHDLVEIKLRDKISNFYPVAIQCIDEAVKSINGSEHSNLYGMAGATSLIVSNKVIRSLNTKMGLLWEQLAICSPYAISPELEFGIKIKGIDLIILNPDTGNIEYTQLKTQKNTLTGSQSNRVYEELSIHQYPVFAAAFSLSTWTLPANIPKILKISGEELWDHRLKIEYKLLCHLVRDLILYCEGYIKNK